ncbi:MAG: sigma-54 dependent transcriptional regulator [Acidobacteriota bacterium]|nr:sigma-54 dependent transcriptional regulator [Acidobacteriota bacterium]
MSTSHHRPRALLADDQSDVLESLRLLLRSEGFEVTAVDSPAAVLAAVKEADFDVVLMDLNYARDTTSGREGLDLLQRLRRAEASLPVVVMTAWGSVELAVEAMRLGARDFVEKPWDNARLVSILRTQVELGRALRRGRRLEAENRMLREADEPTLIARSSAMEPVLELIEQVGPSDANVLITGENGTGKGVVARCLHAVSGRRDKPLISVNAGGLSPGLFESELFGHVRGAFTDAKTERVGRFEMADGGTLLLDEIANVPQPQQAKLLRVLETGEFERVGASRTQRVDVRVLSATNANLAVEVAEGRFRQDLLYRLNTIEIHVPPLRERRGDVEALAEFFLKRHREHYRKPIEGFEPDALELMASYSWPGNVRELDHAVERGVLMCRGEHIRSADLGLRSVDGPGLPGLEDLTLEEAERLLIKKALQRSDGNVKQAAEHLGLSRSALYRRLERHGL